MLLKSAPQTAEQEVLALRREFTLTRRYRPEGLLEALDLIEDQHSCTLVLADPGGVSLQQRLEQGPLPLAQVLLISCRLARTLAALHQQRLIHRNLQPAHVRIDAGGKNVWLGGLGNALTRRCEMAQTEPLSTARIDPRFISPEQTGRIGRPLDHRTDYYSLGVLLFTMLTGRPPFDADNPTQLLHAHIALAPPPLPALLPDIPQTLALIVNKLLAKAAQERYQSGWGIAADLDRCLGELQGTGGTISVFEPAQYDVPLYFEVSRQLFARQDQQNRLIRCFEAVCAGDAGAVLFEGRAGSGKTSLGYALCRPVLRQGGFFIYGKSERSQTAQPYVVLTQILNELARHLLLLAADELDDYRTRLNAALGDSRAMIAALSTECAAVLGIDTPQPLPDRSRERELNDAIRRLLTVCARAQHPLVLFLDDWQWLDESSRALFESLLAGLPPYLLLLAAVRDNTDTIPSAWSERCRCCDTNIEILTLQPFTEIDAEQFIAGILHSPGSAIRPLAQLLYQKTAGNPQALGRLLESLQESGWLYFVPDHGWTWASDRISALQTGATSATGGASVLPLPMGPVPMTVAVPANAAPAAGAEADLVAAIADGSTDLHDADMTTQLLTGVYDPDRLLQRLITLVLQSSGAQRAVLVSDAGGEQLMEISADVADGALTIEQQPGPVAGTELPVSVLRFAARTLTAVLIPDVGSDRRFAGDRYFADTAVQSVVCLPLRNGSSDIRSLLYLEHRQLTDVFDAKHCTAAQMLASEAATALTSARLYHKLQRELTQRRRTERDLQQALTEVAALKEKLAAENVYLQHEIQSTHNFQEIVGQSAVMCQLLRQVELVAATDASVLILGETGTGKELIARAIHQNSARSKRSLIKINCAALPATLIESELFGHEKGAFTGALTQQIGRFELADGGTLFLDEIGELPLELQTKLLRVLQEGEFERLGSGRTYQADVRVIAASNRELDRMVRQGDYRSDLYYRLNTFPIQLPALRARREDIPLLAWYFIGKHQTRLGRRIDKIPSVLMQALQAYDWPGNIRELENLIERALILSTGNTLYLDGQLLKQNSGSADVSVTPGEHDNLQDLERDHILSMLKQCGWKIQGSDNAAQRLGLKPSTLRWRMKKLGIVRP